MTTCEVCGSRDPRRCSFGRPAGPCTCWRSIPCKPIDAGRAAFLTGAAIGSPERPATIGGLPFVVAAVPDPRP